MKRKYICFSVDGQIITRADNADIVGGTQNYLYARFSFSEDWDAMVQTAVFSTNNGRHISALIEDGECEVPWEVLRGTEFWIGVFAGDRITSNTVRVPVKTGVRTGATPGVQPTPSAYERLVQRTEEAMAHTLRVDDGSWYCQSETVMRPVGASACAGALPVWDEEKKAAVVQEVYDAVIAKLREEELPILGEVGADKSIATEDLPVGYSVKYEYEDGSTADIFTVEE